LLEEGLEQNAAHFARAENGYADLGQLCGCFIDLNGYFRHLVPCSEEEIVVLFSEYAGRAGRSLAIEAEAAKAPRRTTRRPFRVEISNCESKYALKNAYWLKCSS
jgi:hypothetical protein